MQTLLSICISFTYFSQKNILLRYITFFLVAFISLSTFSQGKKITIQKSSFSNIDEENYPGATIFLGNVVMVHEGAILTCNKAYYYKEKNVFKAIGNVKINQGDTIFQNSDYVDYNGNTKKIFSWGNVILRDPKMTLKTDTLQFLRNDKVLIYDDYASIKDSTSTLKSKNGTYFLNLKKFIATVDVTIDSPDNFIESNHLDYFTNSGQAFLHGPSNITSKSDENKIFTEKGDYNTQTDISHFTTNTTLFLNKKIIKADSIYYEKRNGFASAVKNIKVIDTVENFVAKGNYAELYETKDSIFLKDRAVAISLIEKDSMYIHGDIIRVTGKPEERKIKTFYNVKIFKSDLQGKCDSLYTNQKLGLTKMFVKPILWSQASQITGDSIYLQIDKQTEKLDSLKVLGNAFIIQKDSIDPTIFNQIKGRNMFGKFVDNKLVSLLVKGNAEAINYNRSTEGVLESVTKQFCSNILFEFENNEIISIDCQIQSDGKTFPPSLFPEPERKLKGFIWREDEKPLTKEDIFKKDKITDIDKNLKK